MRARRAAPWIATLAVAAGCFDSGSARDAGSELDAGPRDASAAADAGAHDSGVGWQCVLARRRAMTLTTRPPEALRDRLGLAATVLDGDAPWVHVGMVFAHDATVRVSSTPLDEDGPIRRDAALDAWGLEVPRAVALAADGALARVLVLEEHSDPATGVPAAHLGELAEPMTALRTGEDARGAPTRVVGPALAVGAGFVYRSCEGEGCEALSADAVGPRGAAPGGLPPASTPQSEAATGSGAGGEWVAMTDGDRVRMLAPGRGASTRVDAPGDGAPGLAHLGGGRHLLARIDDRSLRLRRLDCERECEVVGAVTLVDGVEAVAATALRPGWALVTAASGTTVRAWIVDADLRSSGPFEALAATGGAPVDLRVAAVEHGGASFVAVAALSGSGPQTISVEALTLGSCRR